MTCCLHGELGEKVWRLQRENGLTKKISSDLQLEDATLCESGITAYSIGKALGVPRNTTSDWFHRHEKLSKSVPTDLRLKDVHGDNEHGLKEVLWL